MNIKIDWNRPEEHQTRVVVGDIHGDCEALLRLLREVGALRTDMTKDPDHWIAQVGDLMHMGNESQLSDARIAVIGNDLIDAQIIGNHELYLLCGLGNHRFVGQHHLGQLDPSTLPTARARDWHAAIEVDGWLITHAGLHPQYQREELDEEQHAKYLNEMFNTRLATGRASHVIDSVGSSGWGFPGVPGGIFWLRPYEMDLPTVQSNRLRQINGHTPMDYPVKIDGTKWWVNDVGAKLSRNLCALMKEPGQADWLPVVTGVADVPFGE